MEVKQIYELMNKITNEVLGKTDLINEDLSNIVDLGDEIFQANAYDNYVKSLVNHIGKVVFVNRAYKGGAPRVLMDGWEFGSVLEKIQVELPTAQENESWELEDGTSYDPNIFYKPKVSVKFFNGKKTFEIPVSFTDIQVRESFSNPTQLNSFLSMIYNSVDKAMTINMDSLIMRTINNFIGETIYEDYKGEDISSKSGTRAINLLYKYKQLHPTSDLTKETALQDADFLRFATEEINLYIKRLEVASTLFNIGGKTRFTPRELMHVVMLSDFTSKQTAYLQSNTFHDELVKLPYYDEVAYWQGSGETYAYEDVSSINITTASNNQVTTSGIICAIFDRDALGVANLDRRVTTNYNPKAEFTSNWYKFDCQYFNDQNENFICFIVA